MLTEKDGPEVQADEEKKKVPEYRMQIYDSFVFIDEIKKSDEVFLFQSKLEL